jgi:hypothetical protein
MIVLETEQGFVLSDPDNFTALKVLLSIAEPIAVGTLSERSMGLGRWESPQRVFIEPALLRELAGDRAEDAAWEANFVGMVTYAEASGWLDGGGLIQVHVEYAAE